MTMVLVASGYHSFVIHRSCMLNGVRHVVKNSLVMVLIETKSKPLLHSSQEKTPFFFFLLIVLQVMSRTDRLFPSETNSILRIDGSSEIAIATNAAELDHNHRPLSTNFGKRSYSVMGVAWSCIILFSSQFLLFWSIYIFRSRRLLTLTWNISSLLTLHLHYLDTRVFLILIYYIGLFRPASPLSQSRFTNANT